MQKTSKNIIKIISFFILLIAINGCMPKQADGSYPVTYSYHPYNKNPRQNNHHINSVTPNRVITSNRVVRPERVIQEERWVGSRPNAIKVKNIINLAKAQMGKPYVWASTGPDEFDCSGFTTFVYKENGITLPRTAKAQSQVGKKVFYGQLKVGDLLFFRSKESSKISHTGIYLGNHLFIHASSAKKKVIQSHLDKGYYRENFQWGRRFLSKTSL